MAINKDEIDKYIFDPNNLKQCKSYNKLLNIAKKDSYTYISKAFFSQIFIPDNIVNQLEQELWDVPHDYTELSKDEKIALYINQFSLNEFFDLVNKPVLSNSIFKKMFFYTFSEYENPHYYQEMDYLSPEDMGLDFFPPSHLKGMEATIINLEQDFRKLFSTYENYTTQTDEYSKSKWNKLEEKNKILFYNFDTTNILNVANFFQKSTIIITTLKHQNKFLDNTISDNITPIFLKKIEDVDILLNVLEQDLKKQKTISQKKILTLKKLSIENFFSIKKKIKLNLKDKKEIYIVGENGDGKTLLLQAIAIALKGTQEDGLKAFREKEKKFNLEIDNREFCQNNFLAYGSSRNNTCKIHEDNVGYLTLFSGEYYLKNPIEWLIELYNAQNDKIKLIISLDEAIKLLQRLLNRDIKISVNYKSVIFEEKGAEVSFEQLSAGYKGVITIICDLIAKLSERQEVENIAEFQGIVLIDEVELHLHPKWQYAFMNKLRETFPLIQFIVTTHSSTVLLGATEDATFYKIYKENGETKISQPIESIKNLMANALNTSPLFDMTTARARNSDDDFDTSDDYIYTKIHEKIAKKVQGKKAIVSEDIEKMIDEELDNFLKENDL